MSLTLLYASKNCCKKDKIPPVKSSNTFSIDQPTVHWRFQFKYAYNTQKKPLNNKKDRKALAT